MRPSVPDVHISDPRDSEYAGYRALAGQAPAGLIFGLLSPLALIDPLLWIMPAAGLFFSVWALRRIKRNPSALAGRRLAAVGLTLSLLMSVAAPTEWIAYRVRIARQARQFSSLWIDYLTEGQPHKAHQLTLPPRRRPPLDDHLWGFYRNDPRQRESLENYTKIPAVRALLELGPRAWVRFYDTVSQSRANNRDLVEQLYAVTYEEEGQRKSFFVDVRTMRPKSAAGGSGWRVVGAEAGVRPEGL